MAHGVSEVLGESSTVVKILGNKQQQSHMQPQAPNSQKQSLRKNAGMMGSRRIFAPAFKLKVLDSYRNDIDCRGNQRATARKYGIHRRQIQKWLQCEENLRSCCAEGNNSSTGIATPASSPQKESEQHQQQQHQAAVVAAANNATPASPALNLSLARLHGDELAIQQQQPPPPPPPPLSNTVVAAQALAPQQQHHQANYRFHGTVAATAAGYPDFKDKVPIQQQHYNIQGNGDYTMLYQPLASTYRNHRLSSPIQQHNQQRYELVPTDHHQRIINNPQQSSAFEVKVESSSSFYREDENYHRHNQHIHHHEEQQRCTSSSLLQAEIKTERASPDSVATPGPCESTNIQAPHVHSSAIDSEKHSRCILKKERHDNNEQHQQLEEREVISHCDYQRTSMTSSSVSSSPVPSHQDHFESLPPSPRDSDRSTASSSDSEMDYSSQHPNSNGSDLTRRRSFSLRFKLDVLDAFHKDAEVAGNQRATARKFGINRRQVQKWLGQENDLRGVIELCGSNNRQRLGPIQECGYTEETPVDLRTSCSTITTDLGQISPHSVSSHYTCCDYPSLSPSNYADSSLTPPYSTPGCSFSCCQEMPISNVNCQPYYCYSPSELDSSSNNTNISLKRSLCTQSCCYPGVSATKKPCIIIEEEIDIKEEPISSIKEEPIQETPLCLVKPKSAATESASQQQVEPVSSTVPTPPAVAPQPAIVAASVPPSSKKDAILFKPYLDNPVSKRNSDDSPNNNNNNCQDTCNLNERSSHDLALELSFKLPVSWRTQQQPSQQQQPIQHHHSPYLEFPHVRSAFVRYPTSVHYS